MKSRTELLILLKKSHWFEGLPDEVIEELMEIMEPRVYRMGHYVYNRGEVAKETIIINKGDCRVRRKLQSAEDSSKEVRAGGVQHALSSVNPITANKADILRTRKKVFSKIQTRRSDCDERGEVDICRVAPGAVLAEYALTSHDHSTRVYYRETIIADSLVHAFSVSNSKFFTQLSASSIEIIKSHLIKVEAPVTTMWDSFAFTLSTKENNERRVWQSFKEDLISNITKASNREPNVINIQKRIGVFEEKKPHEDSLCTAGASLSVQPTVSETDSTSQVRLFTSSKVLRVANIRDSYKSARAPPGSTATTKGVKATTSVLSSLAQERAAAKLRDTSRPHTSHGIVSIASPQRQSSDTVEEHRLRHIAITSDLISAKKRPGTASTSGLTIINSKPKSTGMPFNGHSAFENKTQNSLTNQKSPFSLVHFHLGTNPSTSASSQCPKSDYYFRVCGVFKNCNDAKCAADSLVFNTSVVQRVPVDDISSSLLADSLSADPHAKDRIGIRWFPFKRTEALPLEMQDHFIIICKDAAIEVTSCSLPLDAFRAPYPASCKIYHQAYACVRVGRSSVVDVKEEIIEVLKDGKSRKKASNNSNNSNNNNNNNNNSNNNNISNNNKSSNSSHRKKSGASMGTSIAPTTAAAADSFRVREVLLCASSIQECVCQGMIYSYDLSKAFSGDALVKPESDYILSIPMYTWIPLSDDGMYPFLVHGKPTDGESDKLESNRFGEENFVRNLLHTTTFYDADSVREQLSQATIQMSLKSPEMKTLIESTYNDVSNRRLNESISEKLLNRDIKRRLDSFPANTRNWVSDVKLDEYERQLKKNPFLFDNLAPEARIETLMQSTAGWSTAVQQQEDLRDHEKVLRNLPITISASRASPRSRYHPSGKSQTIISVDPNVEGKILKLAAGPMSLQQGNVVVEDREDELRLEKNLHNTTVSKQLALLDTLATVSSRATQNINKSHHDSLLRRNSAMSFSADKSNVASVVQSKSTSEITQLTQKLFVLADVLETENL